MVDLHCHLLPGLDDGPATVGQATELALASHRSGVNTAVATPHYNHAFRPSREEVAESAAALRASLDQAGCSLRILTGAEIAIDRLSRLSKPELEAMTLGGGDCLLVESPFQDAPDNVELMINDLMVDGFRVLLAHPERSGYFHSHPDVLKRLIGRGVLCSLTASSFTGRFGRSVRKTSLAMAAEGLAANVSSDAHDLDARPPGLGTGSAPVEGLASQQRLDELSLSLIALDEQR